MGAPAVGDVVLIPFPFSDLSDRKLRPAFVAAEAERDDLILAQITSRPYGSTRTVRLAADAGGLDRESHLRTDKLFTADARLIVRRLGTLDDETTARARSAIAQLFS